MDVFRIRNPRWHAIAIVAAALIATSSGAETTGAPERSFSDLTHALVEARPLNLTTIENLTGMKLSLTSSNGFFDRYEAHGLKLSDTTIQSIEFREPSTRGGSTGGPFLLLTLADGCIRRDDIFSRYKDLKVVDQPRGSDAIDDMTFSNEETWGQLNFEFSAPNPNCLRAFAIDVHSPAQK